MEWKRRQRPRSHHHDRCGVLERGFARVACASCHYEILVPFSCETRGLCPSCAGRRMADGAAFLVDHLLPREPDYRQWTLSLPHGLRARVLRDKSRASAVLAVFVRSSLGQSSGATMFPRMSRWRIPKDSWL